MGCSHASLTSPGNAITTKLKSEEKTGNSKEGKYLPKYLRLWFWSGSEARDWLIWCLVCSDADVEQVWWWEEDAARSHVLPRSRSGNRDATGVIWACWQHASCMFTLDSGWFESTLCDILSNDYKCVKRLATHFSKVNVAAVISQWTHRQCNKNVINLWFTHRV